jgi:sulfur carrier protein
MTLPSSFHSPCPSTTTPANAVHLHLNGAPHAVPPQTTLAALVQHIGQPADAVATAVNGHFVPRSQRASWHLHAGDQVSCFQAIVGG